MLTALQQREVAVLCHKGGKGIAFAFLTYFYTL